MGRNLRWSAVALGWVALGAGCVPMMAAQDAGVPTWAQHVRTMPIDPDFGTADTLQRLIWELSQPNLVEVHLAPERIALLALEQNRQGHTVDAALFLAVASYRYHEETVRAIERGFYAADHLPVGVRQGPFIELVKEEVHRFGGMNFYDELDLLRERLTGQVGTELAMQQQLAELGKAGALDRSALHDALAEWQPKNKKAGSVSQYPALVKAFQFRLLHDFEWDQKDRTQASYLARTPIPELQAQALKSVGLMFQPAVCAGVADSFPELRPTVVASLASARPEERGNAAAVLGLAPSSETQGALQARLAVETNPLVKLVLAFALFRHGDRAQLDVLKEAIRSCAGPPCGLPASLIQWLPLDVKSEIDQALIARVARDPAMGDFARSFATVTLRDIGRVKALDAASVDALIIAARGRAPEDRMGLWAMEAIGDAAVLSRNDILPRLDDKDFSPAHRQDHLFPGPLLARLSQVATEDDLPLLGRMMTRFGERPGPEAGLIVDAALRLPGQAVDARLVNWYGRYPAQETHIALGLVHRASLPAAQLERLLLKGRTRTQIAVRLVRQTPDAETMLLMYLRTGKIGERADAAELAGLAFQAHAYADLRNLLSYKDALYYPNDALVRHIAMKSMLRIALVSKNPPSDPPPTRSAPRPDSSVTP